MSNNNNNNNNDDYRALTNGSIQLGYNFALVSFYKEIQEYREQNPEATIKELYEFLSLKYTLLLGNTPTQESLTELLNP